MYFSRVRISPRHLPEFARFYQYNHYQLHQVLWRLFKANEDKMRDFLFCQDKDKNGLPVFYLVSKALPVNTEASLILDQPKPYHPKIISGEQLHFKLRANPIIRVKQQRSQEEKQRQQDYRQSQGLKEKMTKKRQKHDVVMHLKHSLTETERLLYSQAQLEQIAGEKWLTQISEKNGFKVIQVTSQGYQQHQFKKRGIKISTLDFEGLLAVTDTEAFIEKALYQGVGSAKAFGCGLLLIKRS